MIISSPGFELEQDMLININRVSNMLNLYFMNLLFDANVLKLFCLKKV